MRSKDNQPLKITEQERKKTKKPKNYNVIIKFKR